MTGRILVDARLPWGSGIGRYVRNIVPPVAMRMSSAAFTLLVSPADADRAQAAVAGCRNVEVSTTRIKPFSLAEQVSLPALASDHDLTWFTNYWVPLRWKGRIVATVHDLMHLDPRFPASVPRRIAAARTFAKVRRDAAHVIFVSRFTDREFRARVGTPRASSVVHHGIDHAGDMGGTASGPPRGRTALVIAASKEHKNLSLLLDAWRRADLTGWQLTLVTPADDLRSSIDLAGQAERIPGVHILRGIGDGELADLYAKAGFVLVPSRYEGFGLPLLEAMRAGAPVISSTADALVEVASGALLPLVAPADTEGWVGAIRAAAAECESPSQVQAAITARNRAIAGTFTWERAAGLTADILRTQLGS